LPAWRVRTKNHALFKGKKSRLSKQQRRGGGKKKKYGREGTTHYVGKGTHHRKEGWGQGGSITACGRHRKVNLGQYLRTGGVKFSKGGVARMLWGRKQKKKENAVGG